MMELRQEKLGGFRPVFSTTIRQEETLESIVPDALPDISYVIRTSGNALLRQREVVDGSIRVTGTVCATVLYRPEDGAGPCSLTVNIPFLCSCDHPAIGDDCRVQAGISVISADARTLNPRKVLVRAEIAVRVTAHREDIEMVSLQTEEDVPGLQTLIEKHRDYVAADVVEKSCSFSDVLRLPGAKPAEGQLLSFCARPGKAEARAIGKKLVVKGTVSLGVLYASPDGLNSAEFELPYSQIADVKEGSEDCDALLEVALTGLTCQLRSESEVEAEMELLIQAAVRQEREITLLADLYSIFEPICAEHKQVKLTELTERGTRRQLARQFCPTQTAAKIVVDCRHTVGEVSGVAVGEKGSMLTGKNYVDVLYLSEDNTLCAESFVVQAAVEIPAGKGQCICRCSAVGDVTAVPVSGGMEIRFEEEFDYLYTAPANVWTVSSIRNDQQGERASDCPSVVIRMLGEGERLWDAAKSCASTVTDIQTVNSLAGTAVPPGTMLLIPKSK